MQIVISLFYWVTFLLGFYFLLNKVSKIYLSTGLSIILSFSFLHILTLFGLRLNWIICFSAVISLLGFFWKPRSVKFLENFSFKDLLYWFLPIFVWFTFVIQTLMSPLEAWDARSIFYLHSRMIYFADGFRNSPLLLPLETWTDPIRQYPVWSHPMINWSHPDYPKLAALLGAIQAKIMGFWNESHPKLPLIWILLPIFLEWGRLIKEYRWMGMSLGLAWIYWAGGGHFWSGYMDAFVAAYASIVVIKLLEKNYLEMLLYAFFAAQIKNEGQLVALIAVVFLFFKDSRTQINSLIIKNKLLLSLVVLPVIYWRILRKIWKVGNDLTLGARSLPVAWSRLTDGESVPLIFRFLFWNRPYFWIFILAVVCSVFLFKTHRRELKCIWNFWSLYFAGIFWVYLTTYWGLGAHLDLSADRVGMSIISLVLPVFLLGSKKISKINL